MNPVAYRRATEAFLAAVKLPSAERQAYIAQLCGDDDETLRVALDLLESDVGEVEDLDESPGVPLGELPGAADLIDHPETPSVQGYELLDVLGSGASGIVYRARQTLLDREVALKLMHPGGDDSHISRRLALEAHVLGSLDHPGIVRVLEVGEHDTPVGRRPFLAMELVEGEPLHEHCRSRDLDDGARLRLIVQLAEAVQHAHERGVIHRDLKPANVLVTDAGEVRVLDFGIARPVEHGLGLTTLDGGRHSVVGTLGYMSPEQLLGDVRAVDMRCDVYALGAITYELLARRAPFDARAEGTQDALRRLVDRTPIPLGSLDPRHGGNVEAVVRKAMATDKAERYGSAELFAADVRHLIRKEPVSARPPGPVERLVHLVRSHRVVSALAFGLLLALVVGAVGLVQLLRLSNTLLEEQTIYHDTASWMARYYNEPVPGHPLGEETVLERMRCAGDWAALQMVDHPVNRGVFLFEMGRRLRGLSHGASDDSLALAYHRTAVELIEAELGPLHWWTLVAKRGLISAAMVLNGEPDLATATLAELAPHLDRLEELQPATRAILVQQERRVLRATDREQDAIELVAEYLSSPEAARADSRYLIPVMILHATDLPPEEGLAYLRTKVIPQVSVEENPRLELKARQIEAALLLRAAEISLVPADFQRALALLHGTIAEAEQLTAPGSRVAQNYRNRHANWLEIGRTLGLLGEGAGSSEASGED